VTDIFHVQLKLFEDCLEGDYMSGNTADKKRTYWLKRATVEVNAQADAMLDVLDELLENDMDMVSEY
jgi:hypothetical protein